MSSTNTCYLVYTISCLSCVVCVYYLNTHYELNLLKAAVAKCKDDISQLVDNIRDIEDTDLNTSGFSSVDTLDEYSGLDINSIQGIVSYRNKRDANDKGGERKKKKRRRNNTISRRGVQFIVRDDAKDKTGVEQGDCGERIPVGFNFTCPGPFNFWKVSNFTEDDLVYLVNGVVIIKYSGLYHIYAQMTLFDTRGRTDFEIVHMKDKEGTETVISRCVALQENPIISDDTQIIYPVWSHCHTSRVAYLKEDDQVWIKNGNNQANQVIKMDEDLTYWGLIHLADI